MKLELKRYVGDWGSIYWNHCSKAMTASTCSSHISNPLLWLWFYHPYIGIQEQTAFPPCFPFQPDHRRESKSGIGNKLSLVGMSISTESSISSQIMVSVQYDDIVNGWLGPTVSCHTLRPFQLIWYSRALLNFLVKTISMLHWPNSIFGWESGGYWLVACVY